MGVPEMGVPHDRAETIRAYSDQFSKASRHTNNLSGHNKKVIAVCVNTIDVASRPLHLLPPRCHARSVWQVHSVSWSCNGTKVASGSVDQTARIWTLSESGKHKARPAIGSEQKRRSLACACFASWSH